MISCFLKVMKAKPPAGRPYPLGRLFSLGKGNRPPGYERKLTPVC